MSNSDPQAEAPPVSWSELGVSELLPTGTVTLLLADVEGSTQLWETRPEEMTAAFARLDQTLLDAVAKHDGVRPVEQGEGDSFVVAFARASAAVACALELQRAPVAPIRLRIGVHTGEVQLRDEGNYIGPAINRTARLRDLAHGGQTVLSGATEPLVVDSLPADAWLTDLGNHQLRDLPRSERVTQLCHPDVHNEFPPLRTAKSAVAQRLPVQLTSFVGRAAQIEDLRQMLADNRLVTLTGAGGVGKTRLAVRVAAELTTEFGDGVWYVDLAPITHPDVVPVAAARTLGLSDQPGRSTMETLLRSIGERHILVVLDNCEHLLDATAALTTALLGACPGLTLLATSREPIAVAGEVIWLVPSLSLADEAVELFSDRARRSRPDFCINDDNAAAVTEICRRLDGMPLAIELAAARVRALSLTEIVDSLHDRFRLLTGGARTAVRRQQTLRASVDWSHALLTEPERVLLRRLAPFLGGCDLDGAQAVTATDDAERYQVLDQLTLLVDKSLVVAEDTGVRTRYRLLETVRQYALEKLGESGEADNVRTRHGDYYTAMAVRLDTPAGAGPFLLQVETEIDNLRGAFSWRLENRDIERALQLASSLQPLWLARGRHQEGLSWFDAVRADPSADHAEVTPAVRAAALADKAALDAWLGDVGVADCVSRAEQAVAIARELQDPALLARTLTACGCISGYTTETAGPYLDEAIGLARALGDGWRLSQILNWQALGGYFAGDPSAARVAAQEGRDLAEAMGDVFGSRTCRLWLAWADMWRGNLTEAIAQFSTVAAEAEAAGDVTTLAIGLMSQAQALAYHGDPNAARAVAGAASGAAYELGGLYIGNHHATLVYAALAAGDAAAALEASQAAWPDIGVRVHELASIHLAVMAQAALAGGELIVARRWADDAVSGTAGWHLSQALTTRARVAIAQGEPHQAERDAHDALSSGAAAGVYLGVPDTLECLAGLAADSGSHHEAVRLFGAAEAIRQRSGEARFTIYEEEHQASVGSIRDAVGAEDFDGTWAEGAALTLNEAIAYAQRGRGENRRATSGWASLTPTELEVVSLVREGLANKDIATRLFVSPRTVQTHLTHVYTKLGLTSRVQLAQEAARHT